MDTRFIYEHINRGEKVRKILKTHNRGSEQRIILGPRPFTFLFKEDTFNFNIDINFIFINKREKDRKRLKPDSLILNGRRGF
jgi:hypothetical protein